MAVLRAIQSTILKQDPTKQAKDLPLSAKYPFAVGATLEITSTAPAANSHIQVALKQPINGQIKWFAFAAHVKVIASPSELEAAKNREQVFKDFLEIEQQEVSDQFHLSFLDRGVANSPYQGEINQYVDRLRQLPDGKTIVSLGSTVQRADGNQVAFSPYPTVGKLPQINTTGLEFLHPDIEQACVCIGNFVNGQIYTHWLGRNALTSVELWSATKIVPIVNVVCQANAKAASVPVGSCTIVDPVGAANIGFLDAATQVVNYQNGSDGSNSLAATFKRFSSRPALEKWLRSLTGNNSLEFRGFYGNDPTIENPRLQSASTTILTAPPEGSAGNNSISTYDLTRLISMVGWHYYLPATAKLPAAQWHSLQTIIKAMGHDTARYVDVAIAKLGMEKLITAPIILSKLGFGASGIRNQTELTYVALVQFVDELPKTQGKPAVLRTLALALKGTMRTFLETGDRDLDEEARQLDARVAAEITEILRRVITQELV